MSKLISLAEAAQRTSTSSAFWRRLAARGAIPTVRLGRARRIREGDFDAICRLGLPVTNVSRVASERRRPR